MTDKLETLVDVVSTASGSPLIYPYERPVDLKDCVVYKLISNRQVRDMQGNRYTVSRIQIDCYGTSLSKSTILAETVKNVLDLNKTNFIFSYVENEYKIKEIETGLWRTILEFFIW